MVLRNALFDRFGSFNSSCADSVSFGSVVRCQDVPVVAESCIHTESLPHPSRLILFSIACTPTKDFCVRYSHENGSC